MKKHALAKMKVQPQQAITRRLSADGVAQVVADWLGDKSKDTQRSYKDSMDAFARFSGTNDVGAAVIALFALSHGEANLKALQFKNWLRAQKHAPGGINTRLSALRSFVTICHTVGLVPWTLYVKSEKAEVYKDTRGPGADGFDKMLSAAADQKHPEKAARDIAILWLLYGQAIRREGVASLDLEHLKLKATPPHVMVMLKGHRERTAMSLSPEVIGALKVWLKVRGDEAGPLFMNADPAHKGDGRLCGNGIYRIVAAAGKKADLKVWPHALRHAGTTTALDETGGDLRAVQRFTGHKDVRVLMRYDDNRKDFGGEVAKAVGKRHRKKSDA